MTATDIAAALIAGVKLYEPDWNKEPFDRSEMVESTVGDWLSRAEVLAALTSALDPAIAERAGELLPDLQISADDGDIDCKEAVSLITALLTANAALRAERDILTANKNAAHELRRQNLARAEAAEAVAEKLRGALQIARVHVANNAEGWSVSRGAARDDLTIVDASLATEEGHE